MFLKGLREQGIPMKFSSWHTYTYSNRASSSVNIQIPERSRSVKAIFALQRRSNPTIHMDSGAGFWNTFADSVGAAATGHGLQNFQYRIGGRYFPASPVQCSTSVGVGTNNGGAESYVELQKTLNCLNDARLSPSIHTLRWQLPYQRIGYNDANTDAFKKVGLASGETDFGFTPKSYSGDQVLVRQGGYVNTNIDNSNISYSDWGSVCGPISGTLGTQMFAMATNLETSNGMEISGLNAEEQSDISLLAQWDNAQNGDFNIQVFTYYDAMLILRENNVLELIQ